MNNKEMTIAFMEWAIIKMGYRSFNRTHWYEPSSNVGISTSDIYDKFIELHPSYAQKEQSIIANVSVAVSRCKTCGHPFTDDVCCKDCMDLKID